MFYKSHPARGVKRSGRIWIVDTASPVKPSQNVRHGERSEAIHAAVIPAILDGFVATLLAITGICVGALDKRPKLQKEG
ncbi:MAG: hypothetical protein LBG78_00725 [Azoarcus sp.]|nr:hypothetical protein [Azoarcus sp.]